MIFEPISIDTIDEYLPLVSTLYRVSQFTYRFNIIDVLIRIKTHKMEYSPSHPQETFAYTHDGVFFFRDFLLCKSQTCHTQRAPCRHLARGTLTVQIT